MYSFQIEKNYMDAKSGMKMEPLVLHESPKFIGLVYSENRKVMRNLQDQAIMYGIDVLDMRNIRTRMRRDTNIQPNLQIKENQ